MFFLGLLWSQRENCYVGYLDFENEMHDYQAFAIQYQHELELTSIENNSNSKSNNQNYGLATQVHQIVWHSITHNFAFPISYYGINNITAHSLNTLLFSLAAKLECIGIHTVHVVQFVMEQVKIDLILKVLIGMHQNGLVEIL